MTANVSIITKRSTDVMCVPSTALKFTPDKTGQKYPHQGIWLLSNGKPLRVDIKEGASDDANVEIISDKVKLGEEVILSATTGKSAKQGQKSGGRRGGPPGMFR